jgi:tetratricopeptide (TPR) repeat protein
VSKFGNEARIIVRLIDGKSEQVIWSQPYKRSLTAIDLLEIQSDIAQQVAKTLDIALNSSVKQRMAFIPTESSEAYDLYLQGIDRTLTFSKSEQLLKSSISIDSGFADAYSALAVLNIWEGGHNGKLTRDDVINKVNPLLAKAFQLDENSVRAHLASAALKLYYYWDFKGVEKEMEIITRISPGDYENLSWFTDFLLASGKLDEALEVETRKFKYSQTEITGFVSLALALYFNNQQDKSNEILKKAWQIFGNNQFLILNSVRIYDYTGRYQDAIDMYEKHYRDTIPFYKIPYFCGHLGVAFFKTGNKEKSGEYLDELLARSQKTAIGSPAFFAAAIYTSMGDKVNAIRLLDQAYRNKEVELYWLKVDPLFRSLHDEPGFRDLIRKMGL